MIVYKGKLHKSLQIKNWTCQTSLVLSTLVTTWLLNTPFHLLPIWLQPLVDINSESHVTLLPSFCGQPSEVTVLFNLNLSRHPFLRQVACCFAQDSILNMRFCSYVIFLLRDQCLIERFSKAMGEALVSNNFSPIPSKISFHMKKKVNCCVPKFTKHLNLVDSWTDSVLQEW